jgi:hypothetical protein
MKYYIKAMVKDFPYKVKSIKTTPWTKKLFKVDNESKKLDEERKGIFHTFVMKAMFLCKRARTNINPVIGFLSSRVTGPNEGDWKKLLKVLEFLNGTMQDILTLEADNSQTLTWYVNAASAVHTEMKSQTGAVLTLWVKALLSWIH